MKKSIVLIIIVAICSLLIAPPVRSQGDDFQLSTSCATVGACVTVTATWTPNTVIIASLDGVELTSAPPVVDTGESGLVTFAVLIPATTAGMHDLTVTDGVVTVHYNNTLNSFQISPKVVITDPSTKQGIVGSSITIVGTGFCWGVTADVYMDDYIPVAMDVPIASNGSFTVVGTVPNINSGSHEIWAEDGAGYYSETGEGSCGVPDYFTVLPSLTITPTSGFAGTYTRLYGTGWCTGAGSVNVYIAGYGPYYTFDVGADTVLDRVIQIPADLTPGVVQIQVTCVAAPTITRTVNFTVAMRPLSLSPTSGPRGTVVLITGSNMTPGGGASIAVGSLIFGSIPWNKSVIYISSGGTIVPTLLAVPSGAPIGANSVTAIDTSGLIAYGTFTVTVPTTWVSPTAAPAGSLALINGAGWVPGSTVTITLDAGVDSVVRNTIADGSGNIMTSINIPNGLTTGPYQIQTSDTNSNVATPLTFTVTPGVATSGISQQLSSINSFLVRVWGCNGGSWQMYDSADLTNSDLTDLVEGTGYWINVYAACTLVYGDYLWMLEPGWNLIGWVETGQRTSNPGPDISIQLASIMSKVTRVWGYDNSTWFLYDPADPVGSDLNTMTEGMGYWLAVADNCTLTYLNNSWSLTSGWNLMGWIEAGQHTANIGGAGSISGMSPQLPCAFHSAVQVNGANVADGTVITAMIGNATYTTTTPSAAGASTYKIVIAQPAGANYDGMTVSFKIGNATASQTGTWQMGGNVALNLSVGETVANFPDPNLQGAIRQAIGKPTGDIYQSDLANLTSLTAENKGISDLSGLEYCTSLTSLDFSSNPDFPYLNHISDISPLSGLTSLTKLDLTENQINNVTPLSGLTSLITLHLFWNRITNISALSGLTSLTDLGLAGNHMSDISPLSSLTKLSDLGLDYNQISNISALSSLTSLGTLSLDGNQISNIAPLSSLTSLNALGINSDLISDISPLSGLTNLTYLSLNSNQISNVTPLSGLTNLTNLSLNSNQIGDISPLVNNSGLGSGDCVDLRCNNLDTTPGSQNILDIQTLINRGVTVDYESEGCTPAGSNVQVAPIGNVTITFKNTSTQGITTATQLSNPTVANYQVIGGSCYDIATTATCNGNITISLHYDTTSITVLEDQLRILHFEAGQWVDVTQSVDTINHIVTGEVSSLSPFVLGYASIQITLKSGWNMVSVPVTPDNNSVSAVFPGAVAVYTWNPATKNYTTPTTVLPEKGYWVAVTAEMNITVSGAPVSTWTSNITAGWNMIGSVIDSAEFTTPNDDPDLNVQPFAYWWDPVGKTYVTTTTIELGEGYWVASVQDCTLTLP